MDDSGGGVPLLVVVVLDVFIAAAEEDEETNAAPLTHDAFRRENRQIDRKGVERILDIFVIYCMR